MKHFPLWGNLLIYNFSSSHPNPRGQPRKSPKEQQIWHVLPIPWSGDEGDRHHSLLL